ncbi:MAG: molybdopterin-containing oxidoreductase family protein [Terriglobales bacterium]
MSFRFDRRSFLRFAAGGAAGAAASGVSLEGLSTINAAIDSEQVRVPSGPESWATGVCNMCPGGCGLRIRRIGARAVKIQGNPLHPVSRGGLCPKGLAGLQELYHPDRLRKPLRNTGTRDNPRWKEVSTEEALGIIVERMRKLRDAGESRSLILVDRQRTGMAPRLLSRFMTAYGSPNYLRMPSGLASLQAAVQAQQGLTEPVAYDLANSRYVLSFGANLLEGWGAPVANMRAFSRWRDASGKRTKFVQIEPRLSMTAARADEWVSIRPGTEATLALGIANVLISEGLYDANFVREHTFGFEDWRDVEGSAHIGFKSLVKSEYTLNDAAGITGVPADTILRLAREAAENRPVVAIGDHQTSSLPGNTYAAMAVHSLNALLGSLEVPGGVLVQQPLPGTQEPSNREGALLADLASPTAADLPAAIASRQPYPVQMLLLNQVNPVFALPHGDEFRKAMREVPFVVSFSSFVDDTSVFADLVLPVATGVETWQDAGTPPTTANAVVSISPPAIASHPGIRHFADVVLTVARALGGPIAASLPFEDYEHYLRNEVNVLFAAQAGAVFGSTLEDTWNRLMERSGWWAPSYSNADELWEQIKKQGGWWEPAYSHGEWSRVLRTKSGKFEFYSQSLANASKHRQLEAKLQDRACLPHQPGLAEPSANFPLLLMPIEQLPLAAGEGGHLPYLQQIAGQHVFANWDSWLEIHPNTAQTFGISDSDLVWIESRRGRVQARARFYEGTRPGVVHLPLGYGHKAGSEWACRGANPLEIVEQSADGAALPSVHGTYVKVYRA